MKILLTGADGFTGRHFSGLAAAAGHEVVALKSDLIDCAGLEAETAACAPDAVVHLAGIAFVGHADEQAFYAVNTIGTTNLLSALTKLSHTPRRVLIASSANIYGNCQQSPIAETQVPAPVNHYAASKLAMEHMARTYAERLPLAIARPFNYTGPGQNKSFVIPKLVDHFARKASTIELGNLNVEREYNDVRMVGAAYLALLGKAVSGEAYNVCSGRMYALQQVIDTLATLTGHEIKVRVNPAFVRSNEVKRLGGSPDKLLGCTGNLPNYELSDTLRWMLEAGV